jgi:hypothetical protein
VSGPRPLDTSKPHSARRYDCWLGGKGNFAADRESGDAIAAEFPTVRLAVLENRRFLQRVVPYVVSEQGIRQILDIGTGISTRPNVHELVQAIAPDAGVVYVDNDPLVMLRWPRMPWLTVVRVARRKAVAAAALGEAEERAAALGGISVLARFEPDPMRTVHRAARGRVASSRLGDVHGE